MSTDTEKLFAEELKPNEFSYSLKIWLTSASLSPVIFVLFDLGMVSVMAFLFMLFFMLLYGLLFSAPCFALLCLAVKLTNRLKYSLGIKKGILVLAGIVLTLVPFYSYYPQQEYFKFIDNGMIYCYLFSTMTAIIFYKLHPAVNKLIEE
ncbi:hypothetical protein [Chitinophaga sp. S165]|uniref:hypothetical protein n=1 Tax=Chitinophaga sp. S165 TaxID=2135462 RepID=UPI000D717624|nr:hypothetical protein [Chitinophaga sp. S165]PWV56608.1 hypothetical protein C7475_1011125 [Chitinophaga sp. S165]